MECKCRPTLHCSSSGTVQDRKRRRCRKYMQKVLTFEVRPQSGTPESGVFYASQLYIKKESDVTAGSTLTAHQYLRFGFEFLEIMANQRFGSRYISYVLGILHISPNVFLPEAGLMPADHTHLSTGSTLRSAVDICQAVFSCF